MNQTLYSLCHESVFGSILWAASLCGFPPPLKETAINVSAPGTVLSSKFQVSVGMGYFMSAAYTFPSTDERVKDTIVGARYANEPCYGKEAKQFDAYPESARSSLGRPLRLKVAIKNIANNEVVYSQSIASVCTAGHNGAAKKTQVIALIELPEGEFSVDVENVESRVDLAALHPALIIHSGGK